MSLGHGASVVRDGLVFHYDMSNKKSWKGKPTTNYIFTNGYTSQSTAISVSELPAVNELAKLVGGYSNIKLPRRQSSQTDWLDLYSHSGSITLNPGETIFVSAYVYTDKSDNYFNVNGDFGATLGTNAGLGGGIDITPNKWKRISVSKTNTTGSAIGVTTLRMETGNTASWSGGISAWAACPQWEVSDIVTPFVAGTRSNTQAIIDLTNNETITASNLTYNSDNTFQFDGVDDGLVVQNVNNYPTSWADPFTLEAVTRIPTGAVWHHVDGATTSNSGTAIIGRGSYAGSIGLLRSGNNGAESLRFFMRSESYYSTASLLTPQYDTWYHMVGTFDGTSLKLYINTELIETTVMTKGVDVPDPGGWRIGGGIAFGGNTGLYGECDLPEVKIYNRALTTNEIKQNFEALRGRYGI